MSIYRDMAKKGYHAKSWIFVQNLPVIASKKSGDDFLVRTKSSIFHDRVMPELQAMAHSIGDFLVYNV
jgi:hypothetical protein